MRKEVAAMIAVARTQIGVQEVRTGGGNHGAQIDAYHRAAHLTNPRPPRPGYAWCDSFLAWCADETERVYGVQIPLVRTASCDVSLTHARKNDVLFSKPEPGDQVLVMASRYDATHTGLVEGLATWRNAPAFHSIEGNTNNEGGREGYEVARNPLGHPRPVSSRYLFYRWALLLPPEKPDAPPLTYALIVDGKPVLFDNKPVQMPVQGGSALAPARALGEALGAVVQWDAEAQIVWFNGKPVPHQVTWIESAVWAPVRVLAAALGAKLSVDNTARKVVVTR